MLRPAERLIQDLGIDDPADIDLEAIAWLQGLKVKYRALEGCEAMVVGNGDHGIITINSRSSEGRQRFSLGHELGHWRLHKGRLLVCQAHEIGSARKASAPEQAADAYAADLLMPRQILQQHPCCRGPLSFATVHAVAEAFSVSLTAAAIRLVEVEHAPSFLLHHGPQGRKWFVRSPSVPQHWFPKDELDPDSLAFDVVFGASLGDKFPRLSGADAWFDRGGADRYSIKEQSCRVRDGCLTLLILTDEAMLGI